MASARRADTPAPPSPAFLVGPPSWGLLTAGQGSRNKRGTSRKSRSVANTKLPGIVACTGAVVVASESSNPEATPTLKLTTESGDQVLLPLSERTTRQLQQVI